MSANSPVTVETHGGDAELRPVTHRTKHRKEVKRYHQRQLNKQLREEAKARDAQLFLFERNNNNAAGDSAANGVVAAAAALAAPATVGGKKSALASKDANGKTKLLKAAGAAKEAAEQSCEETKEVEGQTEPVAVPNQLAAPLLSLAHGNWDFEFVLRKSTAATSSLEADSDTTPPPPSADATAAGNGGVSHADTTASVAASRATGPRASSQVASPQSLIAVHPRSIAPSPVPPRASSSTALSLVPAIRRSPQPYNTAIHDNGSDSNNNSNNSTNSPHNGAHAPADSSNSYSDPRNRPSGNSAPISVLPIDTAVSGSITKLLNNAHVQRVEGVPAIPMEVPLSPGTDLNRPPRSYLTFDPIYNVHQHAPGFVRDQRVALQHMLATAVANWKDMQLNALIVTSAEAMRTIFEQVYVPGRPLALRVRRIGPTILIDSRASQPSQVREMRQQALFSKALYLMKETHGHEEGEARPAGAVTPVSNAVVATAGAGAGATTASAGGDVQMALALPERRLSSLAASDPALYGVNLHRFSQLLRWHIDSTELLVGNDAPIIVDERTGTEQLVRVKAADEVDSTDTEQRETLQCWFDAMLANVSHVGTYFHCDGTLLSYQVKKTNDLLGYVEGRMAGAALNFTSTTLQWLVKHCTRDGGTYAMFRDFSTDYLKLYEVPEMDDTNAFMAETELNFSRSPAPADQQQQQQQSGRSGSNSGAMHQAGSNMNNTSPNVGAGGLGSSGTSKTAAGGDGMEGPYAAYPSSAPHLNRFSLNFGRTCFHIGQHLYRGGEVGRANDALTLLHRSLRIFLPCCVTEGVARETVVEVVQMLPALVSRKMQSDASTKAAAAASSASSPNNNNNNGGGSAAAANATAATSSIGGGASCGKIGDGSCGGGGVGSGAAEKTPAGFVTASCSSPELYRDALVLCGRFEIPLRRAFIEAGGQEGDALMQAFYARCLVASSAAVCTVVAASLEAYYCGCHHLRVMRRARSEAKAKDSKNAFVAAATVGGGTCAGATVAGGVGTTTNNSSAAALRGVDYRDDVMSVLASMIQDLLQVVVEGLVRLEETSSLISPLHAAEAASAAPSTTPAASPAGASAAAAGGALTVTAGNMVVSRPATTTTAANGWTVPMCTAAPTPTAASVSSTGVTSASNAKSVTTATTATITKEELSSAGHSSCSASSSDSVLSRTCSVHGEDGHDAATAATTTTVAAGQLHQQHQHLHHHHAQTQRKRTNSPARVAVTAVQNGSLVVEGNGGKASPLGTVLDPRTQVDTTPLRSALCELYGDVVMIAMADAASGFTTRALAELGARLEARAQEQSERLPTTLLWLTSLKPDVVSLSFTALRFYGRVATHTRRPLVKLAQVYYLVGKEHHRTARYTKALEALHRARSLLQASHKAPADVAFGDAFGSHGIVQWADVMLLLGDVYRSVVERKLETALGVATQTMSQPLLVGPLHNLPEDADTFFSLALNAYKQGGADEGCKSARSCTLLIFATVLMERVALSGQPASHAESKRIFDLLNEAEALAPAQYTEEREWQTMRLFTVTSPAAVDAVLCRRVEDIVLRASCCTWQPQRSGSNVLDANKQPLWVDADVNDCGCHRRERLVVPPPCSMLAEMQKALVCCGMVEKGAPGSTRAAAAAAAAGGEGGALVPSTSSSTGSAAPPSRSRETSENKFRELLRWIGRATTFLTTVIQIYLKSKDLWRTSAARHQWLSTLRTWGEQTVGSCLHKTACLIALRLLNAAQIQLPPQKQAEAREAFKQITARLEAAAGAKADSDEAHELISKSLKELSSVLTPFCEW